MAIVPFLLKTYLVRTDINLLLLFDIWAWKRLLHK